METVKVEFKGTTNSGGVISTSYNKVTNFKIEDSLLILETDFDKEIYIALDTIFRITRIEDVEPKKATNPIGRRLSSFKLGDKVTNPDLLDGEYYILFKGDSYTVNDILRDDWELYKGGE